MAATYDFGDVYTRPVKLYRSKVCRRDPVSARVHRVCAEPLPKILPAARVAAAPGTHPAIARNLALCSREPQAIRLPAVPSPTAGAGAGAGGAGAASTASPPPPLRRLASSPAGTTPSGAEAAVATAPEWQGAGSTCCPWLLIQDHFAPSFLRDDLRDGLRLASDEQRSNAQRRREQGLQACALTRKQAREWEQRRRRLEQRRLAADGGGADDAEGGGGGEGGGGASARGEEEDQEGFPSSPAGGADAEGSADQDGTAAAAGERGGDSDGEGTAAAAAAELERKRAAHLRKFAKARLKHIRSKMTRKVKDVVGDDVDQNALEGAFNQYAKHRNSRRRSLAVAGGDGGQQRAEGLQGCLRAIGLGGCGAKARRAVASTLEACAEEFELWEIDFDTMKACIVPRVREEIFRLQAPHVQAILDSTLLAFGREEWLSCAETMAMLDYFMADCVLSANTEDAHQLLQGVRERMEELADPARRADGGGDDPTAAATPTAAAARARAETTASSATPTAAARARAETTASSSAAAAADRITCRLDSLFGLVQYVHEKAHWLAHARARTVAAQLPASSTAAQRSVSELLAWERYLCRTGGMKATVEDAKATAIFVQMGLVPLTEDVSQMSPIERCLHDSFQESRSAWRRRRKRQQQQSSPVGAAGATTMACLFEQVEEARALAQRHVERCLSSGFGPSGNSDAAEEPVRPVGKAMHALGVSPQTAAERELIVEVFEAAGVDQCNPTLPLAALARCTEEAMERVLRARREAEHRLAGALALEGALPELRKAFASRAAAETQLGAGAGFAGAGAGASAGGGSSAGEAAAAAGGGGGGGGGAQNPSWALADGLRISAKPGLHAVLEAVGCHASEDAAATWAALVAGEASPTLDFEAALLALRLAKDAEEADAAAFVDERPPLRREPVLRATLGLLGLDGLLVQALPRREQQALARRALEAGAAAASAPPPPLDDSSAPASALVRRARAWRWRPAPPPRAAPRQQRDC